MEPQARWEELVLPLLMWYRENARVLPWRREPTPYRVWVSEIMLQQTRVTAVLDYFRRFMEELPTVAHLAAVEKERLMKLWQGLGYYSRARNLQKAAKVIVEDYGGQFPRDYKAIRALPGIGDYTAGAITSIAFGQPNPAVDGNVLRVVSRVLADPADIAKPETKKRVTRLMKEVIPPADPGAFNQALMDLGATVCLPNGAPLCAQCPLAEGCLACQQGKQNELPVKAPKKPRRVEERQVYLILHQGRAALRRRPEKGLLAGLWEYPNELRDGTDWAESWGLRPLSVSGGGWGKHIFTHIEWHMELVIWQVEEETLPPGWVWANRRDLGEIYPVPNAFAPFQEKIESYLDHFGGLL